jgi:hypothetical protein
MYQTPTKGKQIIRQYKHKCGFDAKGLLKLPELIQTYPEEG